MTLKSGSRDLALETMDSTREGGAGGAGSVERVDAAVTAGDGQGAIVVGV